MIILVNFTRHYDREVFLKSRVREGEEVIYNQQACTSSLVHYVEGTKEQANEYAGAL